jgi:predicted amidophosphoribosyltransferase
MLAMKLLQEEMEFDLLTWAPISRMRKWKRGYDQVELIAKAVGRELGIAPIATLKKRRNNPPQSGIRDAARRRANVFGVYQVLDPNLICGKRILLLDDIMTTGATAGECARMLLTDGAKEVYCAAVAVASHNEKTSR